MNSKHEDDHADKMDVMIGGGLENAKQPLTKLEDS